MAAYQLPAAELDLVAAYEDDLWDIGQRPDHKVLRSARDFARKEWPLRGSPADVRSHAILRSAGGR